jgi:hypothetical protein
MQKITWKTRAAAGNKRIFLLGAGVLCLLLFTVSLSLLPKKSNDIRALEAAVMKAADHVSSEGPAACAPGQGSGLRLNTSDAMLLSPLVVVAHNCVSYLARTMMVLLSAWRADPANVRKFPLFISVDGGDHRTLLFAAAWKEVSSDLAD